jgi:hypothetical protein
MQQQVEPPFPATETAQPSHLWGILRRLWPYLLMVAWAVAGLAYTDLYPARSVPFWQLTTVVFALIAIVRVYQDGGSGRHVLALKQLAHWGAFLGAMFLLHSHFVTDLLTGDPLGLVTLILLALATFLDGVYVDWRFCVVGIVLAIGVILLAVIDDAALAMFVVGVVALAALYGLRHFSFRRAVGD